MLPLWVSEFSTQNVETLHKFWESDPGEAGPEDLNLPEAGCLVASIIGLVCHFYSSASCPLLQREVQLFPSSFPAQGSEVQLFPSSLEEEEFQRRNEEGKS